MIDTKNPYYDFKFEAHVGASTQQRDMLKIKTWYGIDAFFLLASYTKYHINLAITQSNCQKSATASQPLCLTVTSFYFYHILLGVHQHQVKLPFNLRTYH